MTIQRVTSVPRMTCLPFILGDRATAEPFRQRAKSIDSLKFRVEEWGKFADYSCCVEFALAVCRPVRAAVPLTWRN
jgi:hypothetical protein